LNQNRTGIGGFGVFEDIWNVGKLVSKKKKSEPLNFQNKKLVSNGWSAKLHIIPDSLNDNRP